MKEKYLKLAVERAIDAYKNGTQQEKKLLILLYGKEEFLIDVKDRVTGYETACKFLKRDQLTLSDFSKGRSDQQAKREFARHRISTTIEAINNGWVPDWEDESQYKYYNYFRNKRNGFSSGVYFYDRTCYVGSDLCLENRENANYVALICKDDYIEYLF